MSQETFKMLTTTDINSIGIQLALQCAPLLNGLKISNLVKINKADLNKLCSLLHGTGIHILTLLESDDKITLLLYRKKSLEEYLLNKKVLYLLEKFNYINLTSTESILKEFKKRFIAYNLGRAAFPHEIGLILGYPVADVAGFIQNRGKKYLACGYWKVYSAKDQTLELFSRFDKAKEDMLLKLFNGEDLSDIISAYNNKNRQSAAL